MQNIDDNTENLGEEIMSLTRTVTDNSALLSDVEHQVDVLENSFGELKENSEEFSGKFSKWQVSSWFKYRCETDKESINAIENRVDSIASKQESNQEEAIKQFADINNNVIALQQWTGKYDPSSYPRFYVMGDGSRFTGGTDG